MSKQRRRVVHVVYSFSIGGLENVIVQLINRLPTSEFEHVVVSLTTISDFKSRVERPDVRFIALNKSPGHAIPLYPKIFRLFRELRADVLHTCNLAPLELVPLGWLAGIPRRIHVEHGWDAHDPDGSSVKYRRVRKLYRPFVGHWVAVSKDLDTYLANAVGIGDARRSLIINGVDTNRFRPAQGRKPSVAGMPFEPGRHWLLGTVGRMQTVKNQPALARAFVRLCREHAEAAARARLVMVGEGPLRAEVEAILREGGCSDRAWLPGARNDVDQILRALDCFVLPSRAEGTSCTLQEAMSCGLPLVATAVGGTPGLINSGVNGFLVPPDDDVAMADALSRLLGDQALAGRLGEAGRERVLRDFSLDAMVSSYRDLFRGPA